MIKIFLKKFFQYYFLNVGLVTVNCVIIGINGFKHTPLNEVIFYSIFVGLCWPFACLFVIMILRDGFETDATELDDTTVLAETLFLMFLVIPFISYFYLRWYWKQNEESDYSEKTIITEEK